MGGCPQLARGLDRENPQSGRAALGFIATLALKSYQAYDRTLEYEHQEGAEMRTEARPQTAG